MNRRQLFAYFSYLVCLPWLLLLLISTQLITVRTHHQQEVVEEIEVLPGVFSRVQVYSDRIRAYVDITFIDPVTGKQRSEQSLTGKWGRIMGETKAMDRNGRMENVTAPARIAKYGGDKTDGCDKIDQPVPTGQWIAIIERGHCTFRWKIRNAVNANATAVIIYDNEPNKTPISMNHDVEDAVAIFITKEFGDRIVELIEDNETEVLVQISVGVEPSS